MQMMVLAATMVGWIVLAAAMVLRKRPAQAQARKRDRSALLGLALQAVAFGFVWGVRRDLSTPLIAHPRMIQLSVAVLTILLSISSAWLVVWAVRTLGKQWAISARLLKEHKLITAGPYRLVRHPIYTGMFGLMTATGLAISTLVAVLAAWPVYWLGTIIRVRSEEKLLREEFGEQYASYAVRVPPMFPYKKSTSQRRRGDAEK